MKRLVFAVAVLCLCASLYGQAVNGTLLGTITDASGAVVPNAKVTITETRTGISRSTAANENGYYVFPDLPLGNYNVQVEQPGFRTAVRSGVDVLVNTTVRVDQQLQPGVVSETVNVTAEVAMLQTDRSDTGRQIETKALADLPIPYNNRNFQGLLNLVPGTTRAFRPHSEFFNPQDSLSTQVNGMSRLANNLQLEGVDNNHRTGLLQVLIPPIEAIQGVDITTSNYEAELGRAGGAVTNVTLKSGTNNIHGAAYEFNRVSALGSRGFFPRFKPVTTYNYFGGNIGGPIKKNRTFFFGDYLKIYDRRGDSNRFVIPTMDFRNGNLSAGPTNLYDPLTGDGEGRNRTRFANNMIPASRISPIAKRILALVPAPSLLGLGTNFDQNTVRRKDTDSFDIKVDHQQTNNDRFSVRYSFMRPVTTDPAPAAYGKAGGPHGGGFIGTGTDRTQSAAVNYNHIFSPTLVTEVRVGVSRYANIARNADFGTKASEEIGIKGVNLDDFTSGLASIDVAGYSGPLVGYSASLPWVRSETNLNWVNTWTKTLSNHTVKWGVDIRRIRDDLLQNQTFNPRGVFRYRDGTTALNCPAPCDNRTGFTNSFASFLLDIPNQVGRDLPVIFPAWRATWYFAFVQDKWQITPKLTLDAGLRWEYYGPGTPHHPGGFSNYDPNTNSLVVAGIGNNPSNLGLQRNWKDFAPRTGIAYRLREKTVLRAGFGLSFEPFPDNTYAYNFPVRQNNAFNALNGFSQALLPSSGLASMASGFPPPIIAVIPPDGIIPATGSLLNQNYDVINLKFREGYVEAWNFAIQRALPRNFTAEIAYVGNHGVEIPTRYNLNAGLVPGAGSNGQPLFQKFRRQAGTTVNFIGTSSHYHSLQTKFDRRFSNGFALTTAYTFAKATGITDEDGGFAYYINPRRSYSTLSHNRKHTFVQSYIYELPFGRGKPYATSGPAGWLLGGWQVAGVLTLMSGTPLNFSAPGAGLNAPSNDQSPNITGPLKILHGVDDALWFDTSNFSAPAAATFGNLGRYISGGPNLFALDGSVSRKFPIREGMNLEFRADAANVTNTPQFGNPNAGFGNADFGKVRGAGGARSIVLGARLSF